MLKKMDDNKSKDVRSLITNLDPKNGSQEKEDDESEENKKKVQKMTRNQKFVKRMNEYLENKQKKYRAEREEKDREEEEQYSNLFHPHLSQTSQNIVERLHKKKKYEPIYDRVEQVLKQKEQHKKKLEKDYEEKENSSFAANCTFQPRISKSPIISERERAMRFRPSDLKFKKSNNENTFLERIDEYAQRSRIHQRFLQDQSYTRERSTLKQKPTISKRSKELAERSRSYLGITDRLYEDAFMKDKKLDRQLKELEEEIYPFHPQIKELTPKTPTPSRSQNKIRNALDLLDKEITANKSQDNSRSFNDSYWGNRSQSPIKSILKTPSHKGQGKIERVSSKSKTKKKVLFNDYKRPGKTRPETSYMNQDGCVNILLDKNSINEIKRIMKGGNCH